MVIADAGYWHTRQIQAIEAARDRGARPARERHCATAHDRAGSTRAIEQMREKLDTERGRKLYAQTEDHDRAGVRPDQTQPPHRPFHAKRPSRRAVRVATDHRHPQSAQASQPLDRHPGLTHRVRRSTRPTTYRSVDTPPVSFSLVAHFPTASRRSDHSVQAVPVPAASEREESRVRLREI